MIVYNKLGGLGKIIYTWANKGTINLIQKVEPSKWIEIKKYNEIDNQLSDLKDEVSKKRDYIAKNQSDRETLQRALTDIQKEKSEKDIQILKVSESITLLEEQIRQHTEEKNRFRILHARYGKYDKYIEVTKVVSDLLHNKGNLTVTNDTFQFDPFPYKIKELFIEYVYQNKVESITVNEEEIVELKDSVLNIVETEGSKEKRLWIENQNKLVNLFENGEWVLNYLKTNETKSESEKVKIDMQGTYFANEEPSLNLIVRKFEGNQIILDKILLDGKTHTTETLSISSDHRKIEGQDNNNYNIRYQRRDPITKA